MTDGASGAEGGPRGRRRAGRAVVALSDGLDSAAELLAIGALVVLVGAVMTQVVARYVLFSPPTWTEELARYAMIWAGLMGATLSFKRRFDPALFDGGADGPRWRTVAAGLLQSAVVLIYLLPILWHSFYGPGMNPERGFVTRHMRTTASAMDFATIWVAAAVPIMIVLVLIHLVARWSDDGARTVPSGEDAS